MSHQRTRCLAPAKSAREASTIGNRPQSNWAQIASALISFSGLIGIGIAYYNYSASVDDRIIGTSLKIAENHALYYNDTSCLQWCVKTADANLPEGIDSRNIFWLYENLFYSKQMSIQKSALSMDAIAEAGSSNLDSWAHYVAFIASEFWRDHQLFIETRRIVRNSKDELSGIEKLSNLYKSNRPHQTLPSRAESPNKEEMYDRFADYIHSKTSCPAEFNGGHDEICLRHCESAIKQVFSKQITKSMGDLSTILPRGCRKVD